MMPRYGLIDRTGSSGPTACQHPVAGNSVGLAPICRANKRGAWNNHQSSTKANRLLIFNGSSARPVIAFCNGILPGQRCRLLLQFTSRLQGNDVLPGVTVADLEFTDPFEQ